MKVNINESQYKRCYIFNKKNLKFIFLFIFIYIFIYISYVKRNITNS